MSDNNRGDFMLLNERKLKVLKAIVKEYIETAEAVGSRTLSRKYNFGVSPATLRNEMADLEDMGYLIQPHTSSGRVPTDKGYRLYVDSLMSDIELEENDKLAIENCIEEVRTKMEDIESVIHETSRMLSKLTNYTTVAVTMNAPETYRIKHIQLVNLNESKLLLILVTDKGVIKSEELVTKVNLEQAKLNLISDNLTRKLGGMTVNDIDDSLISYIKYEVGEYAGFVDELLHLINNEVAEEHYVTTSGATNIFNYPEFSDVIKAKSFLNMMERKDIVEDMINMQGIQKDNLNIVIGTGDEDIGNDFSIVTATYNVGDDLKGKISFIGPTRMDYARLYSIINYMSLLLNKK